MKTSVLPLLITAGLLFGVGGLIPANAQTADGKVLFEKHCSACHNFDGQGGIGLPLTHATLSSVTDDYLRRTIRVGRVGRIMPAFGQLDDAEVGAIVSYLRHLTGPSMAVMPESVAVGDAEQGRTLFSARCSACHGADGRGAEMGTGVTLSRGRAFTVAPPAIVNPGFLSSASDPLLVATILNGRPGTVMPPFARLGLNEQDAADLVAYLRVEGQRGVEETALSPPDPRDPDSLTHIMESSYDLETTVANIKRALKGYNFRGFPDRKLEQGLTEIDKVDARQIALRFCNFNRLYDLLRVEPRLGVVLPCRITVIEDADGRVTLYAPNLRTVATWFNNSELSGFFSDMDDSLLEILEEATL